MIEHPSETTATGNRDGMKDALILGSLMRADGFNNNKLVFQLLSAAGNPQALWEAPDSFLRAHLPEKKRQAFLKRRDQGLDEAYLELHLKAGIQLVACTDPRYPDRLRQIYNAPVVLYVKGRLDCLGERTLGIVGTRDATEYGKQATEKLVREVRPAGSCIASGLAAGIDTFAHWAALHNDLPTAAVFGCGLDVIYPSGNRKLAAAIVDAGGVLISEYPLTTQPTQYTFPQRNRIVAGLSAGVVVVEGDIKSGALITARIALEEGRSVYAVPGNIFNPVAQGPLYLMQNGALPVGSGDDILKDLHWDGEAHQLSLNHVAQAEAISGTGESPASSSSLQDLTETESRLLKTIPYDPVAVEALIEPSGLSLPEINETLTMLELDGHVILLPGARVCRK